MNWTQGTTYDQPIFQVQKSDGTPLDLSGLAGSAITLKTRPNAPVSLYGTLQGTVTILMPQTAGQFSYQFASGDVATAGNFLLVVSVLFGSAPANSTEIPFIVSQAN